MNTQHTSGLETLDFIVINDVTQCPVAAFMLPGDALHFIKWRATCNGPSVTYIIQNADGSSVSPTLSAQANAANTAQPECAYPRCLAEGCDKACARVTPLLEGDAVRIPTGEDEAAAMVLVGMSWLQTNAPHRLRKGFSSPPEKEASTTIAKDTNTSRVKL